jgi:glucose-6-phosphate 1-dehydrogenase
VITFKDPISSIKPKISSPEAYERLLREAMLGDHRHFASFDELKASWDLFDPVLKYWEKNVPEDFPNYPAGSDGLLNEKNTNSPERELVFK